jgi:hypothetical protein
MANGKCPGTGPKPAWPLLIGKGYNSKIALGATDKTYLVFGSKKKKKFEQAKDILIVYKCPDNWMVFAQKKSLNLGLKDKFRVVDPKTCDLNATQKAYLKKNGKLEMFREYQASLKKVYKTDYEKLEQNYSRLKLQLFSLDVPLSFIAEYSLTGFYLGVCYVASASIRTVLFGYLFQAT